MPRRTRVLLVLAFAAALLLASGGAAPEAGGVSAEAMPALRASSFVLEGEEEVAYPRRRALYSGGFIDYGALTASKAACYGPCPARGQPYSSGCQAIYQCRG